MWSSLFKLVWAVSSAFFFAYRVVYIPFAEKVIETVFHSAEEAVKGVLREWHALILRSMNGLSAWLYSWLVDGKFRLSLQRFAWSDAETPEGRSWTHDITSTLNAHVERYMGIQRPRTSALLLC
jgi:hypothetical protein